MDIYLLERSDRDMLAREREKEKIKEREREREERERESLVKCTLGR